MNKIILKNSLLILLTIVFAFSSCSDDEKNANLTLSKVYFVDSKLENRNVYNIIFNDVGDEFASYKLALYKSGVDKNSANAKIAVLTEQELNAYNQAHGQNFKLISTDIYTIDGKEVSFSGQYDDINKILNVKFDIFKLRAQTENVVLPIKIIESSIDINKEKSVILIKPVVRDIPISFAKKMEERHFTYKMNESEDLTLDILTQADIQVNELDVDVEVMVDAAYINQYNQQNGTYYKVFESSDYELTTRNTMKKGEKTVPFTLKINGDNLNPGQFMLPVRLKSSSKYVIDPSSLFFVRIDIVPQTSLDRIGWTIADFNTEEAVGEGSDNGRAIHAIDGNTDSFWHSQWKNGNMSLPHYLVIDMQKQNTITQVGLMQRQSNDATVKKGDFWISDDNTNWTKIGDYNMTRDRDVQIFFVAATKGRYLKINITESYHHDSTVTSLSEIYPYGY